MKLPSIAPWDHWNRKLLLTAAGCAVAIVVFLLPSDRRIERQNGQ